MKEERNGEREREEEEEEESGGVERREESGEESGASGRSMMRGPRGSSMSDRSGSLEHLISWQLWYMCREGEGFCSKQQKAGSLEAWREEKRRPGLE